MALTDYSESPELTPMERRLVRVCQHINEDERAKRLQTRFHEAIGMRWVSACMKNLLDLGGLEHMFELRPDSGVIICSNHRSFFDMYVIAAVLRTRRVPWVRDMFFPVRSPFFYEKWSGLVVNLLMGGGAMYPPIFRDASKSDLNKLSVERIVHFLTRPGVVVGMHPEGTRGKGPDPHELLPAQPGVGQMALKANVPVVPIWIEGLSNDMPRQIASNFGVGEARPIILRFGRPVDLADLRQQRARATVYKRAADRILDAIRELGDDLRAPA